jgi:hypothetical protein
LIFGVRGGVLETVGTDYQSESLDERAIARREEERRKKER